MQDRPDALRMRCRLALAGILFLMVRPAAAQAVGAASASPPPPPAAPPPGAVPVPPSPPPGIGPWRTPRDARFYDDRDAVKAAVEAAGKPRPVLEDYRRFTEQALSGLEQDRQAGRVDRGAYREGLDAYRRSIGNYRDLWRSVDRR